LRKLSVRALPKDLPDGIDINITDLRIGQSIRVEDVSTTNFEIINPSSAVICSIKMARGAVDESDDEGEEGAEAAAEESAEA
jgi:large subunit ribosomal protein L25